jgi:Uma2 family endonuclease
MTNPVTELPDAFRPLTVREYEALFDHGLLTEDDRVELVGGVLIDMPPPGPEHIGLHIYLTTKIAQMGGERFYVSAQNPLLVDDISMPQPDLAVIAAGDYAGTAANPSRATLLIEIAVTTRSFDLGEKARRYAMNDYPEYWVVDHAGKVVHVHRGPRPDGTWTSVTTVAHGPLSMLTAPEITIDVDELFSR